MNLLFGLSVDLLDNCLDFLNLKDIRSLQFVYKDGVLVVKHYVKWASDLYLIFDDIESEIGEEMKIEFNNCMNLIQLYSRHLKCLVFGIIEEIIHVEQLYIIIKHNRMTFEIISGYGKNYIIPALLQCPNLRSLCYDGIEKEEKNYSFLLAQVEKECVKKIEEINVNDITLDQCYNIGIFIRNHPLRRLRITGGFDSTLLEAIEGSQLETLELICYSHFSSLMMSSFINLLSRSSKTLCRLLFRYTGTNEEDQIREVVNNNFSQLLYMSYLSRIYIFGHLPPIIAPLLQLAELDFITTDALTTIFKNSPLIEHLSIHRLDVLLYISLFEKFDSRLRVLRTEVTPLIIPYILQCKALESLEFRWKNVDYDENDDKDPCMWLSRLLEGLPLLNDVYFRTSSDIYIQHIQEQKEEKEKKKIIKCVHSRLERIHLAGKISNRFLSSLYLSSLQELIVESESVTIDPLEFLVRSPFLKYIDLTCRVLSSPESILKFEHLYNNNKTNKTTRLISYSLHCNSIDAEFTTLHILRCSPYLGTFGFPSSIQLTKLINYFPRNLRYLHLPQLNYTRIENLQLITYLLMHFSQFKVINFGVQPRNVINYIKSLVYKFAPQTESKFF